MKSSLKLLVKAVQEDAMQASNKGGNQQSYTAYEPHQQPTRYNNSKGAVVAPLAVTNSSLIVFKTCSTIGKSCLVLETWPI